MIYTVFLSEDVKIKDKQGNSLAYYLMNTYSAKSPDVFETKLEVLKQNKIALDEVQGEGNTLLHLAVQKENLELIKRVMDFDVDLNAKNDDGNTALHIAAMKAKDNSILKYLIQMGADKHLKTDFEESVFDA